MVNLSAAGLGVSTSNANQSIAEGLQGLTQGLVQGMKLKYLKEQQAREQQQYEDERNQTQAAQRGLSLLANNAAWKPPDQSAGIAEGQHQIEQAGQAITQSGALAGTPFAMAGDMLSRGAASSSKPLGQALDWEALKQHQTDFMQQVSKEVAGMDPRVGAQVLAAAKQGLVEDAMLLHRSHAVSQAHDDIVGGAFDTFTPDGQVLRDPEIVKRVSDLATQMEQGAITPEQYEAQIGPLRDQAHASWVENKQRFYRAQSAQKDLDAIAGTGKLPPDAAVSAQHQLAVGRYDPKQFAADWPHLLEGKVLYKGEWETPETVGKMQKLEQQFRDEQSNAMRALAEERRQQAYAKSPMGKMQQFALDRALQKEKASGDAKKSWQDSFDKAMAVPGRTIDEATKIANTATGMSVQPQAAGANGVAKPGEGAAKNYAAAAEQFKGKSRAEVVSALGSMRASGQITDEDGKAIIAAMGGLPAAPPVDPNSPEAQAPQGALDLAKGGKVNTAELDADRKKLLDAEKSMDRDSLHALEVEIMKKYGFTNAGQLYAFKQGTMRPGEGVLK